MKEIIFRGFHKDESGKEKVYVKGEWIKGYWVEGYLSKSRDMQEKPSLLKYCIDYEDNGVMMSALVIPETVGQYTGLKDKNGKKIFEGDIFKFNDEVWESYYTSCGTEYNSFEVENYGVVGFDNHTASFDFIKYKFNQNSVEADLHENHDIEFFEFIDPLEIIGNIHSNPELSEV